MRATVVEGAMTETSGMQTRSVPEFSMGARLHSSANQCLGDSTMDIIEQLTRHAQTVNVRLSRAQASERETERLLVEPFIEDVLGFSRDEFTAQPEIQFASSTVKCDFALNLNEEQVVLIECKRAGVPLSRPDQLGTYLERKPAPKIGIYTDGAKYHIYGTHIEDNIKHMDSKPLLSFDFQQQEALSTLAEGVRFLTKDSFSPGSLREWASQRERTQTIQEAFRKEFADPSAEVIRLLADRAGIRNLDDGDIERLKVAVRQTVNQAPSGYAADLPISSQTDSALSAVIDVATTGVQDNVDSPYSSKPGLGREIRWRYKGQEYTAVLHQDGSVRLPDGRTMKTPSGACKAVVGQNLAINGWRVWHYYDAQQGKWVPISELRPAQP